MEFSIQPLRETKMASRANFQANEEAGNLWLAGLFTSILDDASVTSRSKLPISDVFVQLGNACERNPKIKVARADDSRHFDFRI
ncbi:MAG TPA: hypothetical protein PLK30_21835 [Blastocatellia bacterium]|nr:hypothetical protein [Blastocatellia bacterium]